jgi:serine protease Do
MMLCLLLGACGQRDDSAAKAGGDSGELVSSRAALGSATVQIVAEGSFVDPEVGQVLNAAGSGSGFIIDPSGIAVTNNHVVTGSALLQVYVAGEDEPRNAKVLGVSECSDLAVIDIDGEGYPYFKWRDGEITTGLDVYAAGFPLGDPEFTLTRGIVSKANASGETVWASVDSVLEHDATINPGNSGGPLVDDNSRVVGVNYAGSSETNQYYAITSEEALEVIAQLREEQNVDSIGVNGQAVVSQDETVSGIWVSSVESGSPADEAGVRGGDVITKLEGLVLATDGTMADYCDVLRSRDASDTMNIEVLRYQTGEVLEGQLNGRNLEPATALAPAVQEQAGATASAEATTGGATYSGYTTVTDDSGALQMDVPTEWSAVNGAGWTFDGETVGRAITASADLDAYANTWGEPGAFFGASSSLVQSYSVDDLLDYYNWTGECEKDARYDYQDELYTGKYDLWVNCGEEGSSFLVLAAVPENQEFITLVNILITNDADLEAADQILNTFQVVGDL